MGHEVRRNLVIPLMKRTNVLVPHGLESWRSICVHSSISLPDIWNRLALSSCMFSSACDHLAVTRSLIWNGQYLCLRACMTTLHSLR